MGWIKRTDNLPGEVVNGRGWVLVHWGSKAAILDEYCSDIDICTTYYVRNGERADLITHWMPLPLEPVEDEEKEGVMRKFKLDCDDGLVGLREEEEIARLETKYLKAGEIAENLRDENTLLRHEVAELKAKISDAWRLAYNLWPGDKSPSEFDLAGVIRELSKRYLKKLAEARRENERLCVILRHRLNPKP
jgi:hypothetical protein